MAGKSSESLDLFFVIVTVGMILLSLAIISAVFFYQQKLQRRRNQLKNVEIDYQKNLLNASIEAREMEQRRIAFELHDDIGSTLTAIKFSLANAKVEESVMTNLNNAIQKVRRISYELLPSILDEMGLLSGATSLVNNLNDQIRNIEFSIQPVRDPQSPEQTKEIELALYRVLQELLNNIVKYANASTVNVLLIQNELGIDMIIEDDGDGFNPESVNRVSSSLGLRNMEMRIQQIDGSLKFEKKSKGTRVVVKWETKNR